MASGALVQLYLRNLVAVQWLFVEFLLLLELFVVVNDVAELAIVEHVAAHPVGVLAAVGHAAAVVKAPVAFTGIQKAFAAASVE